MSAAADGALAPYLGRWGLQPDGPPRRTASSALAPVRRDGARLVLKVPLVEEERRGGRLMAAWDGRGAAPVLASDADGALLLARADDPGILAREAAAEVPDADARDDAATRILARSASRLHRVPVDARVTAEAVPLGTWFRALVDPDRPLPRGLARGAAVARELLATPGPVAVLHGDVHHGNVLRFDGEDDWRAIDPKGLVGHPAFDTANVLANPTPTNALRPGRLARRARVIAEETGADLDAVLAWAEAWCALSAAWDVDEPTRATRVAAMLRLGGVARDARPGSARPL
ncbi:aminoglycoside phosphotransferase family protein [Clavibacter zhangzhiyongii]|uniref:Streptomycin phosphotransferase n=1 Tax=Clavibacter zhangzhiyongii TaxID=2768071 RepID=A0A7L7Z5X6_9MICO|nr:aminoglycoside phosphotransferase family protein [Clavibacter zhangzhiyongii]QOD45183.1 streptomycin phosphotransferase [Clavibacter zhangzhiyongii]